MKRFLTAAIALCLAGAAWLLLSGNTLPGWNAPELLTYSQSRRIVQEITQAADVLSASPDADIDTRETLLINAGFPTVDTDAVYPSHLANSDGIRSFWDAICAGESAAQTVLKVKEGGEFLHMFFVHGKDDLLFLTQISMDTQGNISVSGSETLPLYEMELSEWDIFYYRCYPANDPHYIDYNQFRLQPADRELYDLTRKYILPVGYQMVNLFLCDWQEGNWDGLHFNDVFEYLYEINTGKPFPWQEYPPQTVFGTILIPAQLFEDTVLPYFQISREYLREICRYDNATDSYPWRPVHGDDLTAWDYPYREPQVVAQQKNGDGTITLKVQVYSADVKTNNLFSHEVTLRPLEDGGFQYVGNRITSIGDRGLPPAMSRFTLDEGA